MLCAKFGLNLSSGSKEVEHVKSLQADGQTNGRTDRLMDRQMDRRWTKSDQKTSFGLSAQVSYKQC